MSVLLTKLYCAGCHMQCKSLGAELGRMLLVSVMAITSGVQPFLSIDNFGQITPAGCIEFATGMCVQHVQGFKSSMLAIQRSVFKFDALSH